jgi:hypothetical protein
MTAGVLVAELRAWIEAVAHEFSRHLELEHVGDGSLLPDREPPGWPPQDPRELRLRGASVGQVARRPDAVGVLGLDGRIRTGSRRSATLVSGSSQPPGRVAVERRCEQPVSSAAPSGSARCPSSSRERR